jgi:hypothetical protein
VEAGRSFGSQQRLTCFNVSVTRVEGSREEGKQRGGLLLEGEVEEASLLQWSRYTTQWHARSRPAWPIGPRLEGIKECWVENGEKNRKLDYEFLVADLEFGDSVS